ncbi:MAG: bifunctional 5,10-methylenetetrahydrofolate dehydrogenase/5,10-methenyltetrahydrofolate cyclohydrolase [bacterium]|nr:bifunctional 5,10-methylenetetrahydrofolate dehydrogenase/5,10-methenyltetrahydrofolate cyclohydrolase [bacterium]
MEILDGKKCSQQIIARLKEEVAGMTKPLRLAVVVVGTDPVVQKFIARKRKAAEEIGIDFRVYPFEETVSANELRARVAEIVHEEKNTGVVIQLPLPVHIGKQHILNAVTPEKDVDVLSARAMGNVMVGKSPIISPVAGAVKALFEEYKIEYKGKRVVVMGAGALVGKPVALWLLSEGVGFSVVNHETLNAPELLKEADIIISGIGKQGFITGGMVKEGVVIVDAGTSESNGKLAGDVDFETVSKKASFITPVPGGVGPMTVAMLLHNVVELGKRQK